MRENMYIAIGHWENSKNITSLAQRYPTIKDFRHDLRCNGFTPYVVITESRLAKLKMMDSIEVFEEVIKMTSNYNKWNDVADYITECMEIIDGRIKKVYEEVR